MTVRDIDTPDAPDHDRLLDAAPDSGHDGGVVDALIGYGLLEHPAEAPRS